MGFLYIPTAEAAGYLSGGSLFEALLGCNARRYAAVWWMV